MIGHSLVTIAVMLTVPWLIGPFLPAAFLTGVWYSREQYWDELKLRKEGRDGWRDVLASMFMVFRPMKRNLDLFVPVAVAWGMAYGFVWVFPWASLLLGT